MQKALDDAARASITAALREAGGNVPKAATLLGISRGGLWKRMKALNIQAE